LSLRSVKHAEDVNPPAKLADTKGGAKIEFKSVCFKYPTRDVTVFEDLNLAVSCEVCLYH
jgi:ATP-binding cassette, subfamily B (MDR/TAP), member 1